MVPVSGLYEIKTTRRAEDREMVLGERGGKRLWKVFITSERCGGVFGPGGGKDARTSLNSLLEKLDICPIYPWRNTLTSGGDKYSNPILLARLTLFSTSLTRLYLSTLKLNVGPPGNLTILNDGATSVKVNARRCVT